jgi:hypothetical protein
MTITAKRALAAGALLISLTTGCSMLGKKATAGGGGGGEAASGIGDTMADAPLYHRGDTFTFTAPCRATGYAKFDIPTDEPVKIIITGTGPEGAGLGTSYLKASGGAVGRPDEGRHRGRQRADRLRRHRPGGRRVPADHRDRPVQGRRGERQGRVAALRRGSAGARRDLPSAARTAARRRCGAAVAGPERHRRDPTAAQARPA